MRKLTPWILVLAFNGAFGCTAFQRGNAAVTTPDATGVTPLGRFFKALPAIFIDPVSPELWGSAAGLVLAYVAAMKGTQKVVLTGKTVLAARKAKKAGVKPVT